MNELQRNMNISSLRKICSVVCFNLKTRWHLNFKNRSLRLPFDFCLFAQCIYLHFIPVATSVRDAEEKHALRDSSLFFGSLINTTLLCTLLTLYQSLEDNLDTF